MNDETCASTYVGQVERDPDGLFWAVLYSGTEVLVREHVRSFRKAKRRVTDLVLAAADNSPIYLGQSASPAHRTRLVEQRPPSSSRVFRTA